MKKKNKILLIGSSGVLGKKLFKKLNKKFKLSHNGLNFRKKDLSKILNLEDLILNAKPDIIINCLALTDIDQCEINPNLSYLINVKIVENIFKIKKKRSLNFKYIQISTDQLYDSAKINKTSIEKKIKINNIYAKHKFLAENIAKKNKSLILRTNFFGDNLKDKKTFSYFVIKNFINKKNFFLVDNVYFSPLSLHTLCLVIYKILKSKIFKNINGVFNIGSKKGLSKLEFGKRLGKQIGIYNNNYKIIKIDKIVNTKRSKNMKMNLNKFSKTFKITLPTLSEEIRRFKI